MTPTPPAPATESALRIVSSTERPEWAPAFLHLPDAVYAGDPYYCPAHPDDTLQKIERPRYAGRQRWWLAFEGDVPVARCLARLSPNLVGEEGKPVGTIGFFEARLEPSDRARGAVRELLHRACRQLREEGAGEIYGPLDGDTWQRYRFALGPYDTRPFLMEPYQPAEYPALWEQAGFEGVRDYYSKRVDDLPTVVRALESKYESCRAAGYRFDRLYRAKYETDLRRLYDLSTRIFADNFLFSEISWEHFAAQYLPFESLIDPELIFFARYGDEDVGFIFSVPDLYPALQAMRGKFGFFAKLRFLLAARRVDTVNLKSLGVHAAHRQAGLGSALMYLAYRGALARRYRHANLCLIEDDNPSGRIDAGKGDIVRHYRLYRFTGEGR